MRISAHSFPIETGRYVGTPRVDRICPLCKSGLGNELHYLLECSNQKMILERNPIINNIIMEEPKFLGFSKDQKVSYILSNDNPQQLKNTGLLCLKMQKTFKEVLKSIDNPENQGT